MKMKSLLPRVCILLSVVSVSPQDIRYVRPNDATSCPSSPCLSIDQYAEDTTRYFTTGSTFIFLTGNHSVSKTLSITNVHNLTLQGDGHVRSRTVKVISVNTANMRCQNVTSIMVIGLTFILTSNSFTSTLVSLEFLNSDEVIISKCIFLGGGYKLVSAIYGSHSSITVINSLFKGNRGIFGGAISTSICTLTLIGSTFTGNIAPEDGSVVDISGGSLLLEGKINRFSNNFGKVIFCYDQCRIKITSGSLTYFENNTCELESSMCHSGTIGINTASMIILGTVHFIHNEVNEGGAIHAWIANVTLNGSSLTFEGNTAKHEGGAIYMYNVSLTVLETAHFYSNKAYEGGAIYTEKSNISFNGSLVTFEGNSAKRGGAIQLRLSRMISSSGKLKFINNTAQLYGGALDIGECFIANKQLDTFVRLGETLLDSNTASIGGSIRAECANVSFQGAIIFKGNHANSNGGAIIALDSYCSFHLTTEFRNNSAANGGAMYIETSSLKLGDSAQINTSYNWAKQYGGAIYHKDAPTFSQCNASNDLQYDELPFCFLQTPTLESSFSLTISSFSDNAEISGNFLYGGLLDKCQPQVNSETFESAFKRYFKFVINIVSNNNSLQAVTSKPYRLCFCSNYSNYDTCNATESISSVHRGEVFSVYLQAVGQGGPTTAEVTATTNQYFSRLKLSESTQTLHPYCTQLNYTVYSTEDTTGIDFIVDGTCKEDNLDSAILYVTLLPCPEAFALSGDECTCEERLHQYNATCTIGDRFTISKIPSATFWMSILYYDNGTYQGLILYKTCPTDYCTTGNTHFTLDDLDLQCSPNRSGVLCGACASNYSLLLGSFRCAVCPNTYLVLLLPFAITGISLVAFLSLLKLTVATGVLNSLIVYANIVQANRNLFFLDNKVNVLTVFIAWLNLDLGFETCFYNGMDAYAQTCLQFAFPVFVWILISLIIVTSRYSVTVSKLIGHNPIAVLATLLLMSYTKILKIIIEVFSNVQLDYPGNKQVPVWLRDANEPYLQSRHLLLTVVTCLILVFLFLPYTLFLLLGHKLYYISGKNHFHWLNRLRPLLDSYHAPYNNHTRYWTGFLLVVRCALYLVFSYNSLGGTNKSLLAINITFTILVSKVWFSGRIYKKLHANVIEVTMYLNLIALSAFTLAQMNSVIVVYFSVGVAFVALLAVIVHHFHLVYTAKTALWLKMKLHVLGYLQRKKTPKEINEPPVVAPKDSHIVSKTVVQLREPLLEN